MRLRLSFLHFYVFAKFIPALVPSHQKYQSDYTKQDVTLCNKKCYILIGYWNFNIPNIPSQVISNFNG